MKNRPPLLIPKNLLKMRHRLRLRPEAEIEGVSADDTIREILDAVEAPRK